MRLFQAIFLGAMLLSNAEGKGGFHIKGPFDIDGDGQKECLILNSKSYSILLLEITASNKNDTLWSYVGSENLSFEDGAVIDLNKDGLSELVLIPSILNFDKGTPWVYLFKGREIGFSNEPILYNKVPFLIETIIPSNITVLNDSKTPLGICFSSPIRQGLLFNIKISDNQISLINTRVLSNPNISNGYGLLQMSSFTSSGGNYLAMISAEKDSLYTSIFDQDNNFEILHSKTIPFDNAQSILNTSITPFSSKYKGKNGLLIPLKSDDVYLLNIVEDNVFISTTNISNKGAFPVTEVENIKFILETREKAVALKSNFLSSNRKQIKQSLPSNSSLYKELSDLKTNEFKLNKKLTSIPKTQQRILNQAVKVEDKKNNYKMLSPTLGDFLTDIKKDKKNSIKELEKTVVPVINSDMESVSWADEAGFTRMDLGEYVVEKVDTLSVNPVPLINEEIISFSDEAKKILAGQPSTEDSIEIVTGSDLIDLYYILVMTPASQTRDRYIFDGEAPFGVSVNQIPPTGSPTHFQHGVSANIANLSPGETYDFSYTLRDGIKDSITTLTMIHDIQTNVVLMSISPSEDSISQSYQPESFDPKLFEFPKYFFDGFPSSLDMDFTDKLIRFSFDGDEDSSYQGIYLSSTTPSNPPQSLAVFMDKGVIQSIKGEVAVRANGSKKITTQFDLTGTVEPELMFSKLIQENFPEDLKIKLLQGASLEEPLFGPKGKLPKIIREPRLPDAQVALPQQEVPIHPKQSNIPVIKGINEEKSNQLDNIKYSQPQENPIDDNKIYQNIKDGSELDSLKLELNKTVNENDNKILIPKTEQNKPEKNNE